MVQKKIDNRIRVLMENGIKLGHRTLFVIVGEKSKDQIAILYNIYSKIEVKVKPSVLWCYKAKLELSSNRRKRAKQLKHKLKLGASNVDESDHYEHFLTSTTIRYCYYKETNKILGQTFGMLVLQDFECMTPNLLARTIETVEGGGIIIILMSTISSLKQLHTLHLDIHENYKTDAHKNVVARFNKRFLLSLVSCKRSLVIDDQLTVLPITSSNLEVTPVEKVIKASKNDRALAQTKRDVRDLPIIGGLVNCCRTLDQAKALDVFINAITEKTLSSTVSLTAARGRGKSAALGLAVAAAVGFGYSNIFVTSPSPENLNTFFEFVCKGLDALEYQEHMDYTLIRSAGEEFNKAVVRVNVFKEHRQTIQYIHPTDSQKLSQCELMVIDEAAAIPLPFVKNLLGKYLVFLASTINGYEGTGRSLSLKLLQQLRVQSGKTKSDGISGSEKTLKEIVLEESIRYKPGDDVEAWLTRLLCLDVSKIPASVGKPNPQDCDLYYINRDALFCYNAVYEVFLQRLVSLFVASHYKNSPDDLLLMSDAPAYHLFCLCGPITSVDTLPEVLVAILICLEGQLSKSSTAIGASSRERKPSGDTIPWKIMEQFQDTDFGALPGARIVRIATHPDYQNLGYGRRSMNLLRNYYEFKIPHMQEESSGEEGSDEESQTEKKLPKLLSRLQERRPESLSYLGVSFGLTESLLKFWKQADFIPVYICQTTNDLTGEHSCIMLSSLKNSENKDRTDKWLYDFYSDFKKRLVALLAFEFSKFSTSLALGVLNCVEEETATQKLTLDELDGHITNYEMKRLEMYHNNVVDCSLIMDLLPAIAKLCFLNKLGDLYLSEAELKILLGSGLQHKSLQNLETELSLDASLCRTLFDKSIRSCYEYLQSVEKNCFTSVPESLDLVSATQTLSTELSEVTKELHKKQVKDLKSLKIENLEQYAIKGSEEEWNKALSSKTGNKNLLSIKVGTKRLNEFVDDEKEDSQPTPKRKKEKKKDNNNKKKHRK